MASRTVLATRLIDEKTKDHANGHIEIELLNMIDSNSWLCKNRSYLDICIAIRTYTNFILLW